MPLPNFTVAGSIYDIPGTIVAGDLISSALAKCRVVFRSNLNATQFITFGGSIYRPPVTVYAGVDGTANLVDKDGYPVRLLANAPGLSVPSVRWTVTFLVPTPGSVQAQQMAPITFNAGTAGATVNLATLIP